MRADPVLALEMRFEEWYGRSFFGYNNDLGTYALTQM